jgi:hypothetical protein
MRLWLLDQGLQISTLIFFVASDIAATGRGRVVLLTLKILCYDIAQERDAASILKDLQVASHLITRRAHGSTVRFELQVTQNIDPVDPGAVALFYLDVAPYD